MPNNRGFTLIELMVVVAIIGILSAIIAPNFSDSVRKAREGVSKGNLGTLRSALTIYYADNEGLYPTDDLTSLTQEGKYLHNIPTLDLPPSHGRSNAVYTGTIENVNMGDSARWLYDNVASDPRYGTVLIDCTHEDLKNVPWTTY